MRGFGCALFILRRIDLVYKEKEIIENIKLLYLITLFYFPRQQSSQVPRIICKALEINDEDTMTGIKTNCILNEPGMINDGLIRKGYFKDVPKHYLPHIALTPKGLSQILLTKLDNKTLQSMIKSLSDYNKEIQFLTK